jgi:hypothetical protein
MKQVASRAAQPSQERNQREAGSKLWCVYFMIHMYYSIVRPANQNGCIILCVGNLEDEFLDVPRGIPYEVSRDRRS